MADDNIIMNEQFYVLKDFSHFGRGTKIHCIFRDAFIEFRAVKGKDVRGAKLEYRHIRDVLYEARAEVAQVNKSKAVRYAVGKSLGGQTGAMIGILSGLDNGGKRKKQVVVHYLVISYNGKGGKEERIYLQAMKGRDGQRAEEIIKEKTGKKPTTEQKKG